MTDLEKLVKWVNDEYVGYAITARLNAYSDKIRLFRDENCFVLFEVTENKQQGRVEYTLAGAGKKFNAANRKPLENLIRDKVRKDGERVLASA